MSTSFVLVQCPQPKRTNVTRPMVTGGDRGMFDGRSADKADFSIICIIRGRFYRFFRCWRCSFRRLSIVIVGLIGVASLSACIAAAAASTAAAGARLRAFFPIAGIFLRISTAGGSCPSAAAATPATTLAGWLWGWGLVVGHCRHGKKCHDASYGLASISGVLDLQSSGVCGLWWGRGSREKVRCR